MSSCKERPPRKGRGGVVVYTEHHPILGIIHHYVTGARRAPRKRGRK